MTCRDWEPKQRRGRFTITGSKVPANNSADETAMHLQRSSRNAIRKQVHAEHKDELEDLYGDKWHYHLTKRIAE